MIMKRNLKIGDVVTKWDKDGDGTVSKAEFRANVAELGVAADKKEVDALFEDASGVLQHGINVCVVTTRREAVFVRADQENGRALVSPRVDRDGRQPKVDVCLFLSRLALAEDHSVRALG